MASDIQDSSLGCIGQGENLMDCVMADLVAATGGSALLGLFIGGTLLLALYIAGDGDTAVPTVVTILVGGALIPMLPAQYTYLAYTIAVLGLAFGFVAASRRWVLRGGY